MVKTCSEHGQTRSMVERDAEYWFKCMNHPAKNIYNGYFVDVTDRCNLNCKFCFHPKSNTKDRSVASIVQEAQMANGLGPYILTGGEPTLRPDLIEILDRLKMFHPGNSMLTNAVAMTPELLDQILPRVANYNNVVGIDLSLHDESNGKDLELIQMVRERGMRLNSVLKVIDDVEQIPELIEFAKENQDAIFSVRIKAATRLWAEEKPDERVYVSDMLHFVEKNYTVDHSWGRSKKPSFMNIRVDNIDCMLVTWYDVRNADLMDISCAPYLLAHNGVPENFVTAAIINEGIAKGWLNGRRINGGS